MADCGRGCSKGCGRGNQNQQTELAELRGMIEDLSQAVQALLQREPVEAHMEIPEGDHKPLEIEDLEVENLCHEAGTADQAA